MSKKVKLAKVKNNRPKSSSQRATKKGPSSVKETRFYNSLRDVFVGAKVEGESGYINLMKIKSHYFEKGVFPQLQNF